MKERWSEKEARPTNGSSDPKQERRATAPIPAAHQYEDSGDREPLP